MSEETGLKRKLVLLHGKAKRLENIPEIGVGMLGYSFMGKAHTNAYKTIPYMMYPPPAIPNLVRLRH